MRCVLSVKNISRSVWLGLTITVVFDSFGQILWKSVASSLPDTDDILTLVLAAANQRLTWLLASLLLAQLFLWMAVLKRADLSLAQPLTSLSYVGVGVLSWVWLGESWHWNTILSVALILIGVALVSFSPRNPVQLVESLKE
jgi:drug/metabolite transporter (DMT)-like permease